MKLRSFIGAGGIIALAVIYPIYQTQADDYEIIDIGTLGGDAAEGNDINDASEITGYSWVTLQAPRSNTVEVSQAFIYDGGMHDLGSVPTLDDQYTYYVGIGINDIGHIVGTYYIVATFTTHAFLYDGSAMHELVTPADGIGATANAINNTDQVAGAVIFDNPDSSDPLELNYRAFVFHDDLMLDLGTLGGDNSQGFGINDAGQVVGESTLSGEAVTHAFLYDDGVMVDLGTLGGTNSSAQDISDNGFVTGSSDISGEAATHAFLYDGYGMQDLGSLGGKNSYGLSVNNSGLVVGYSQVSGGEEDDTAAFFYDGNSMLDLCQLTECTEHGWDNLQKANGINDYGDITGYGYIGGVRRAFLIIAEDDDDPLSETEICDDDIDNDFDGLIDCDDSLDCSQDQACNFNVEICDDGIDNDGDGRTDCKDKDCRQDPVCKVTGGGKK